MKMIINDTVTSVFTKELDINGRHAMPVIDGSEKESASVKRTTIVVLDNYDQRDSLEKFLKRKKFKMSDGFVGEQHDFCVGSDNLTGVWRQTVKLQAEDPKKHDKMREAVKEWAHKINSKKTRIPA